MRTTTFIMGAVTCIAGFAAGGIAGGSISTALGSWSVPQHAPAHTTLTTHRQVARTVVTGAGDITNVTNRFGVTAAKFLGLADTGCRSFSVSGPEAAQPENVRPDDPRFKPCSPSVDSFMVRWSSSPTRAQNDAVGRVLDNLAVTNPTITLAQAEPLIRAAAESAS